MSGAKMACPRRGLMGRRERVRKEECIEGKETQRQHNTSLCSSYVMSHVEDGMQVTKMWERGDEGNTTESRSFFFFLF